LAAAGLGGSIGSSLRKTWNHRSKSVGRQVALAAWSLDVGAPARPYLRGTKVRKDKHRHHNSFVGLERQILFRCESWRALSAKAKLFYVYLKAKYNTLNNGKIQLHYSELSDMPGFGSRQAFYNASKELIQAGWVEKTNLGGLYRNPNTYKLTGRYDGML